jgi:hypothetical protein
MFVENCCRKLGKTFSSLSKSDKFLGEIWPVKKTQPRSPNSPNIDFDV